jgi:inward rectifier potassium channel
MTPLPRMGRLAGMSDRKYPRLAPKPIPVGREDLGLAKLGVQRFDWRDPYHLAVSLPWPAFVVAMLACWLVINLVFAVLYDFGPGNVTNTVPGSFSDLFFFSIETLATVGYGVMAPATLYGHIVSAVEIVTGMAFTAIVTGLLFVRFSRPQAKIVAADDAVVTLHNGLPALMLRIVSGRVTLMSNASARLFALLVEQTGDGPFFRRVHELRLQQSHMPLFVMPWLLVHVIDENSPLHGHDSQTLISTRARLFLTIEARDHALSALVQDMKDYTAQHIRFGMRFADMVTREEAGGVTADLSRISLLQPDTSGIAEP